jgi:Arc/MetJ family transcription regulator
MRTNIEIDDKLMKQAMKATGATTKKAAVEACLRHTVRFQAATGLKNLFGAVVWRGGDDDWNAPDEQIAESRRSSRRKAVASQSSQNGAATGRASGTKG